MLRGLVPVSFRRLFRPLSEPEKPYCWPVSSAPIPLHPDPYRIILPDQTICRVPIGDSNSIVANRIAVSLYKRRIRDGWRRASRAALHARQQRDTSEGEHDAAHLPTRWANRSLLPGATLRTRLPCCNAEIRRFAG